MTATALMTRAQESKTATVIFAGEASSLEYIEHFNNSKEPADAIFATASSNFTCHATDRQPDHQLTLSLSSFGFGKGKPAAIQKTISTLKSQGIHYAGLKDYMDFTTFDHNGLKYGFAAFGSTPLSLMKRDSVVIKTIISRLKFKCNIVVIGYSYDTQAALSKSEEGYVEDIRYFSHLCVDAGADIVFVSGNDRPMPLEIYGDRLIIYGSKNSQIRAELTDDGAFAGGKFLKYDAKILECTRTYFPETALLLDKKEISKFATGQVLGVAHNLLNEASKYRGRPYRIGATGPRQFDCSGFTGYIYKLMGYSLPRTAQEQSKVGTKVERSDLQPGDLVFFKRPSARGAGHVGIVYSVNKETNDFTFIHASTTRGVVIDNFSTYGYFVKRYMGARRIIEDRTTSFPAFTNEIDGADDNIFDFNKHK